MKIEFTIDRMKKLLMELYLPSSQNCSKGSVNSSMIARLRLSVPAMMG